MQHFESLAAMIDDIHREGLERWRSHEVDGLTKAERASRRAYGAALQNTAHMLRDCCIGPDLKTAWPLVAAGSDLEQLTDRALAAWDYEKAERRFRGCSAPCRDLMKAALAAALGQPAPFGVRQSPEMGTGQ